MLVSRNGITIRKFQELRKGFTGILTGLSYMLDYKRNKPKTQAPVLACVQDTPPLVLSLLMLFALPVEIDSSLPISHVSFHISLLVNDPYPAFCYSIQSHLLGLARLSI